MDFNELLGALKASRPCSVLVRRIFGSLRCSHWTGRRRTCWTDRSI